LMAALVAVLGWVIVRFSARYLEGEPGQRRYAAALMTTLGAVAVVVLTDHLGILLATWALSSLALHHLLTFHPERAAARVVAHKKFIASRLAELSLLGAIGLVYLETATLSMTGLAAYVAALDALPGTLQAAAVLIAAAVILKSAQLPLHGWLIKVMEAPTPVSALLHAGVVNIGGFVLIRMAELLSAAPAAQTLLVVMGSVTAVVAGLAMMTSVSVKERLAWSTCAQMGFMLVECGLGLYELALLHLIAHSLYKAHAFLTAGETVNVARQRDLAPAASAPSLGWRLAAAPLSLALVGGMLGAWSMAVPGLAMPGVAFVILGLGVAPLLWTSGTGIWRGMVSLAALTHLYGLWHLAFGAVAPAAGHAPLALAVWAGLSLFVLYTLQTWAVTRPAGRLANALRPWSSAGYHLDERFSAALFRLWPVHRPAGNAGITHHKPDSLAGEQA
ncbi:NADH-quinone oxidoreductase subunit L, partial [Ectothiorhodospiraceae bacterium WFHF3C12]|nr:NADH-quinone oxidoreductase subunit L [Ectothiorhodospiraceae bacterium WFHF3C12]